MANFDHQSLEHLKKLCRIQCSEEETQDIQASLSQVLDYIEQLNEVNTDNTAPCRYVLRGMLRNQMREDEIKDPFPRDQFLANAPDQVGGMVKVPPILKPGSSQ
ncbi:MAG: Asp-tRNA(Asn)/Glu-tRNA(Gln) amidotransferase subunit GatC [Chlamydiae bacterium CG10_big_fil_rev_8_21_14_0_10_42_34]|nr:MAG: Asp-tRNA(Asn)/Glu-tRNA(Gln) amidotransferase subunit GatC [Chlamydiae bacterium CG10_big_fil_rev_8_21_14_0_10_42_34]